MTIYWYVLLFRLTRSIKEKEKHPLDLNHTDVAVVGMLASDLVGRGFEPRSHTTKDNEMVCGAFLLTTQWESNLALQNSN